LLILCQEIVIMILTILVIIVICKQEFWLFDLSVEIHLETLYISDY
jgi:hypothetical protein